MFCLFGGTDFVFVSWPRASATSASAPLAAQKIRSA